MRLKLLHGAAGADIDPAEQAMAHLAVRVQHVAHDRLYCIVPGVGVAVDLAEAAANLRF